MDIYHVYTGELGDIGDLLVYADSRSMASMKAKAYWLNRYNENVDGVAISVYLVDFNETGIIEMRDV